MLTGMRPANITVLQSQGQGLHLIVDSDWPLESLRMERGADHAYRVTSNSGKLTVEGRARSGRCLIERSFPLALVGGPALPVHDSPRPALQRGFAQEPRGLLGGSRIDIEA
jgi:hypothetical protein